MSKSSLKQINLIETFAERPQTSETNTNPPHGVSSSAPESWKLALSSDRSDPTAARPFKLFD